MRHVLRFVLPLLAVFGALAWGAAWLLDSTGRRWFQKDLELRAELAVSGAQEALAEHWRRHDAEAMTRALAAITHDERILAASACDEGGATFASTAEFPAEVGCGRVRPEEVGGRRGPTSFVSSSGGMIHVAAIPVVGDVEQTGYVVVVHDMSFAERRASMTRAITLAGFGLMALVASIATLLVARFSWRDWTAEVRRNLQGGAHRREFQPILADIRDLVARLADEAQTDGQANAYTPARLRRTLKQHLHGEKVVVVANREPYIHDRAAGGALRVLHPASGLVTALEPVMRACSGVWVAHGSGSADRETVDAHDRVAVPPGEESYALRRVWLGAEEEKGYYYGLSNEGLWPLCHVAHTRPLFRAEDWGHYRRVNRRFAEAACDEADGPDSIVLVQDYHFALLPQMIRQRMPRATILTFWHIPWPNAERFGICPFAKELLEGLLGSSIVGFHTQLHCNNFLDAVDRYLEARIDRERQGVFYRGRMTLVRPYPISIDWPNRWLEGSPSVEECRAGVRAELGLAPGALLGVGIDRLDYTKGIEERLLAVERLLERAPELRGRFTFAQIAAPSRTAIERYRELNDKVEQIAERINGRFGSGEYRPIALLREHHEPPSVFRYYRAADLCYVSSLHDGMNLVAKEFVAARDDERGVLVLSEFTGAARELTEALIVNPYDLEEASSAMAAALTMSAEEQQTRMKTMRSYLAQFNVYRWADRMLVDAARLRFRDRVSRDLLGPLRSEGDPA